VYWVGPARARELGGRIDGWLRAHPERVQAAQERWFGERQRLDATTHLVDLLARRFAFMPQVAALKARQNLPVEDLVREREVQGAVSASAQRLGLPIEPVERLFALQISLSKAVQRRQSEPSALDLSAQVRPALTELGERILDGLVEARAARQLSTLVLGDLELLGPWLSLQEREQLLGALRDVGGA
jgi:chorismate mutase-like protein